MTAPIARSGSPLPPSTPTVNRQTADPDIVEAAKGLESLFLDQLMQQMRKTVPKSQMGLDSPATEIYQGMLDSEYANLSAQAGGVGLADLIIAYMQQQRYNQGKVQSQAGDGDRRNIDAGTGGTYASQPKRSE